MLPMTQQDARKMRAQGKGWSLYPPVLFVLLCCMFVMGMKYWGAEKAKEALENEITHLRHEHNAAIKSHGDDIESLEDNIKALKAQIAESKDTLAKAEGSLTQERASLTKAYEAAKTSESTIEKLNADLQAAQASAAEADMKRKVAVETQEARDAQNAMKLEEARTAVQSCVDKASAAEAEFAKSLRDQVSALKAQLTTDRTACKKEVAAARELAREEEIAAEPTRGFGEPKKKEEKPAPTSKKAETLFIVKPKAKSPKKDKKSDPKLKYEQKEVKEDKNEFPEASSDKGTDKDPVFIEFKSLGMSHKIELAANNKKKSEDDL